MLRKNFHKLVAVVIAAAVAGSTLAGCGNSSNVQSTESSTQTSAQVSAQADPSQKNTADYSGTITMWGWDGDAINLAMPEFNKVYPNVKVEFVAVKSPKEFSQKIKTSAAANMDLPDIGWLERGFIGSLLSLDLWDNLENDPYKFDKSTIYDYALTSITNTRGEICALPWDMEIAGIMYNKKLAKQYFGTDNPEQLEGILKDWDTLIEKGKEVKSQSGGKVFLFPNLVEANNIISNQNPTPLIDGTTANITDVYGKNYEILQKIRDAGIADNQNGPSYNAAIKQDKCIIYSCPIWYPKYIIQPNDPEGKDRWGLMIPPGGPFNLGGTFFAITKQSKNKELAWQFMNWFLLSEEGAKTNKAGRGFFTAYKKAYDDPSFTSYTDPMFGDQDLGKKFFLDIAPKVKLRSTTKYDAVFIDVDTLVLTSMNNDAKFTAEQGIEKMKKEISNKLPELQIK